MALWSYALATVDQTKLALGIQDDRKDDVVEECVNEASQMVESAWGRHIVSRGSLTEYHTIEGWALYMNEWPVVSVTTVHEDSLRAFGVSSLLNVDTDYIVSKPIGKLTRVSAALPINWACGWRAIKVVYVGGYQNTAESVSGAVAAPQDVLRVFYELTGWMYRQRTQREVGLTQTQDGMGNRTFSGPAYITPAMAAALTAAGSVATSLAGRTGERDA